jgi:transcriptional regulator with XRE-family HTH domain
MEKPRRAEGVPMHKLRGLRLERALSQAALAREAGLDTATVNRLELGRRPASLTTVRKLSAALKIEPRVLMDCGPVEEDAA